MAYPELTDLHLRDCWVAIDPHGRHDGTGIAALKTGGVVVDYDVRLDELCRRIAESSHGSLAIAWCGDRPRA